MPCENKTLKPFRTHPAAIAFNLKGYKHLPSRHLETLVRQVEIPVGMTLLEKMQYEHDPSLLSPTTQQALEKEVQRLKSQGIRMNPGTLTQTTNAATDSGTLMELFTSQLLQ